MEDYDKLYLAYSEYYERFHVSDDNDEMAEMIHQRWCDSGCDGSPENEANSYKVWEYCPSEKKEKYPNTYRKAKKSLIRSAIPLIRKTKEVECNYSVDFVIGY